MPTYAYIATCPAGFEGEAARLLDREWEGVLVTRRSGGAIWFSLPYPLDPHSVPDYLSNVFFRITSYNVCYTKLLRSSHLMVLGALVMVAKKFD